jgi:hypothetical protein
VGFLVGMAVGAAVAWLASRRYYRRATDDLWARLNRNRDGDFAGRTGGTASRGEDPTRRPPSDPPTP